MRISLSSLLAPHYCCSCGNIGSILCEYCKYDIISETTNSCLVCRQPVGALGNLCDRCRPAYSAGWSVGEREGSLKELINAYKFRRARASADILASLFDETLPVLPDDILVVPVPTVAPHIRLRGYAHIELVARKFARTRGLMFSQPLYRLNNRGQRGLTKRERAEHASRTFASKSVLSQRCLLVDDIFTTGATLEYSSRALLEAGATDVWVAVLARQTLEK